MRQAFDSVKGLVDSMSFLLKQVGIRCDMPTGDINRIPASVYSETFDFLHNLQMSAEWRHAVKTKEIVPDHIWRNLELMGDPNMREYKVLRAAMKPVKAMWRPPYPFFGKHYEQATDFESVEQPELRPEQNRPAKGNAGRRQRGVLPRQGEGTLD